MNNVFHTIVEIICKECDKALSNNVKVKRTTQCKFSTEHIMFMNGRRARGL